MTTVNQTQHDTWNGDSGHRWAADADRRDAVLAPIADALLTATRHPTRRVGPFVALIAEMAR